MLWGNRRSSNTTSTSERNTQNPPIHLIFSRKIIFVRSELHLLPCCLWCTKNIFSHAHFCSHCSLIEDRRLENNSWKLKDIQNSVWYLLNSLCTANTDLLPHWFRRTTFFFFSLIQLCCLHFQSSLPFHSCLHYSNYHVIRNSCILSESIIYIRSFTSVWEKRAPWLAACTDSIW